MRPNELDRAGRRLNRGGKISGMETAEREYTDHVGTFPDGSQILVTRWADGTVTIATRDDKWSTWSAPIKTEDMSWTG